jgi:predicted nucleic acid-binding protein
VTPLPLILDSAGLDALTSGRPSSLLRAYLAEASRRGREVVCPTLVCAEIARGRARTRALESAVHRHEKAAGELPAVRLVDTDFAMARQVGAILDAAHSGSEDVVDAHVVAVALPHGGGLVLTSDPDDILRLAEAVPAVRLRVARI